MKDIVLASASPRRSELLKQIGISFRVLPSNIEEHMDLSTAPAVLAQDLSCKKALSIAEKFGDGSLVIGADTIVVKDGILGKPDDREQAFKMLKSLQGQWHDVITGIAVINSSSFEALKGYEKTRVKMRSLSDREIENYVDTKEPMDKAGAYGIQGIGAVLVERIEGCYFNVVGLPLTKLCMMLEKFGVSVL